MKKMFCTALFVWLKTLAGFFACLAGLLFPSNTLIAQEEERPSPIQFGIQSNPKFRSQIADAEDLFGFYSILPQKRDKRETLTITENKAEFWYWKVLGSEIGPLPLQCQAAIWMLAGRYKLNSSQTSSPPARRFFEIFPSVQTLALILFDNQHHADSISTDRGKYRVTFRVANTVIPYMKLTIGRAPSLKLITGQIEREVEQLDPTKCPEFMKRHIQSIWIDPRLKE